MTSRVSVASVALSTLILLLLLAFLLLLTGVIGPISPSPEILVFVNKRLYAVSPETLVFVNDQKLDPIEQPLMVPVKIREDVDVEIQVYYQGQLVSSGEFTYQWCFIPQVKGNEHCKVDDYRRETNSDYKPENLDQQELKIIIEHDSLKTATVSLLFKPG